MAKKELWRKVIEAIEKEDYEEFTRQLEILRLAGTGKVPAQELIRQVLKLACEKLSHVFQDHEGRLCAVVYEVSDILPEIKGELSRSLLDAVQNLKREDLLEVLEEQNVILGLIKKVRLEKEYQEFISLMEKYPKRFNVFSLFHVRVRIGLPPHSP